MGKTNLWQQAAAIAVIAMALGSTSGCEGNSYQPVASPARKVALQIADKQPLAGAIGARLINSKTVFYLLPGQLVGSQDFEKISVSRDSKTEWMVAIQLTPPGEAKAAALTQANVGKWLVLAIDDRKVAWTHKIDGPWKGLYLAAINMDEQEARDFARLLAGEK